MTRHEPSGDAGRWEPWLYPARTDPTEPETVHYVCRTPPGRILTRRDGTPIHRDTAHTLCAPRTSDPIRPATFDDHTKICRFCIGLAGHNRVPLNPPGTTPPRPTPPRPTPTRPPQQKERP